MSVLHRIALALVLSISTALAIPATIAQAQNFPERPIRLIVAFTAGGATDVMSRQIANVREEPLTRHGVDVAVRKRT